MRLGATSITVTGMDSPSAVKTRVIPLLRPIIPIVIFLTSWCTGLSPAMAAHFRALHLPRASPEISLAQMLLKAELTETNLNLDTGRQIQLHQGVYSFLGWLYNIHH